MTGETNPQPRLLVALQTCNATSQCSSNSKDVISATAAPGYMDLDNSGQQERKLQLLPATSGNETTTLTSVTTVMKQGRDIMIPWDRGPCESGRPGNISKQVSQVHALPMQTNWPLIGSLHWVLTVQPTISSLITQGLETRPLDTTLGPQS